LKNIYYKYFTVNWNVENPVISGKDFARFEHHPLLYSSL